MLGKKGRQAVGKAVLGQQQGRAGLPRGQADRDHVVRAVQKGRIAVLFPEPFPGVQSLQRSAVGSDDKAVLIAQQPELHRIGPDPFHPSCRPERTVKPVRHGLPGKSFGRDDLLLHAVGLHYLTVGVVGAERGPVVIGAVVNPLAGPGALTQQRNGFNAPHRGIQPLPDALQQRVAERSGVAEGRGGNVNAPAGQQNVKGAGQRGRGAVDAGTGGGHGCGVKHIRVGQCAAVGTAHVKTPPGQLPPGAQQNAVVLPLPQRQLNGPLPAHQRVPQRELVGKIVVDGRRKLPRAQSLPRKRGQRTQSAVLLLGKRPVRQQNKGGGKAGQHRQEQQHGGP